MRLLHVFMAGLLAWMMATAGAASAAAPQDPDASRAPALDLAIKAMDGYATEAAGWDGFSGVLIVEKGGRRLYQRAFGMADNDKQTPVTLATPFLIASQGKMFTAVAVLQLVEAGKIRLDDSVGKFLRDYPNREIADKVTVRHLLTHRGGTGNMNILEREYETNREWVRSIDDIIKLNGARPPAFEPGSKEEYSNYGFLLLGAIIERVTEQSYYDYVEQHVFRPAGMNHTGFPTRDQMSGVAIGYTWIDKALKPSTQWLPWRGTPAGGGISTADDEARFFNALNAGLLLSKTMLAEATSRQTPWYGYGFIWSQPEMFLHWGHGGGAPGNSLASSYWPRADLVTICMSNRDPPACDHVMYQFFEKLAPAYGVKL
jgi:D-alanyl-D-alanine carboxypeptidase